MSVEFLVLRTGKKFSLMPVTNHQSSRSQVLKFHGIIQTLFMKYLVSAQCHTSKEPVAVMLRCNAQDTFPLGITDFITACAEDWLHF